MNVYYKTGSGVSRKVTPSLKLRSRRPTVAEDEALLELVEQQPSTSSHTLLAELDPSQSVLNQYLYKLGFVNRCWNI